MAETDYVTHTGQFGFQMPSGVTPAAAYNWFTQWAKSAPKWAVPPGGTLAGAGQIGGSGFDIGSVFEIKYHQTVHRTTGQGDNRRTKSINETVTCDFTVTEADSFSSKITMQVHPARKSSTENTIALGDAAAMAEATRTYGTIMFDERQCVFTTIIKDNAVARKAAAGCCGRCCMACCGVNYAVAAVQQAQAIGQRISFGLQGASQDGSINGGAGAGQPGPTAGGGIAEEIAKLSGMLASGLLSEDEFAAAKAKVLGL